jgi:hypothetical protein
MRAALDDQFPARMPTEVHASGNGAHILSQIAGATLIAPTNLTTYLGQLQELRLIEQRLPS